MPIPRRATVTLGTTPLLVAPPVNAQRQFTLNNVSSSTVYVASDNTGDADIAFPIAAGQAFNTNDTEMVYAFVTVGTATVGIWDSVA